MISITNTTNVKFSDISSIFNIETINKFNRILKEDRSCTIKDINNNIILFINPKIVYEIDKSYRSFTLIKSVHITGKVFNKNKFEDYSINITNNEKEKNITELFLLNIHNDIKL